LRPILHHYDDSPFAEKIRLVFGIKSMAWDSVTIAMTMPKPDLICLTGGYRRTPVLQVGADVYCDTWAIVRAIEQIQPAPPIRQPQARGLGDALSAWADRTLMWTIAPFAVGHSADDWPEAFHRDRAEMHGRRFDLDRFKTNAPQFEASVRAQLEWIEHMLSQRPFLVGEVVDFADLSVYHTLWFMERAGGRPREVLHEFPRIIEWMERISRLGHGNPSPLSAADAKRRARQAEPALGSIVTDGREPVTSLDAPSLGEWIAVSADDYGREQTRGRVVRIDGQSIVLAHQHAEVGAVHVHFPPFGYRIRGIEAPQDSLANGERSL
jgi:glutathione S-transferase